MPAVSVRFPMSISSGSGGKSRRTGMERAPNERTTQRMLEGRKPKHLDELETDPNVKAAILELERVLGTKVRIVEKAKQKGRIEIDYYSPEDLDRIYTVIVSPRPESRATPGHALRNSGDSSIPTRPILAAARDSSRTLVASQVSLCYL